MRISAILLLTLLLSACSLHEHAGRSRLLGPSPTDSGVVDKVAETVTVPCPIDTIHTASSSEPTASLSSIAPIVQEAPSPSLSRATKTIVHIETETITAAQDEENLMPKKKWNRLAIPAFVAALGTVALGLFTSSTSAVLAGVLITLLLAGIALRRIRIHEQSGKGFAFAALMIGVIAALITALTIANYGLD